MVDVKEPAPLRHFDLRHLIDIPQATTRVRYDLEDMAGSSLRNEIEAFISDVRPVGNSS